MKKLVGLLLILLSSTCWGADIYQYLNTNAAAGGDGSIGAPFNTMAAFEAQDLNLTDSGGDVLYLVCSGTTTDTTAVTFTGWTTSAANYIDIGGDFYGTKYSSMSYCMRVAGAPAITLQNVGGINIRLHNLQVVQTTATAILLTQYDGGVKHVYNNLLINTSGSGGGMYGVKFERGGTHYIYNNILLGWKGDGNSSAGGIYLATDGAGGNMYIYNNTIDSAGIGAWGRGVHLANIYQTTIAKGNIVQGYSQINGYQAFDGTFANGTDYNAVAESTTNYVVTGGGNIHDRTSQTFLFVSTTSADLTLRDYALRRTDTGALNQGPSSDITSGIVTTDILGATRPYDGIWDIGAHELREVSYINTDNVGTENGYTLATGWKNLAKAEVSERQDLTAKFKRMKFDCYGTAYDTTTVIFNTGWTTNSTYYLTVYVSTSSNYKLWGATTASNGAVVYIHKEGTVLDGLDISNVTPGANSYLIGVGPAYYSTVRNCKLHDVILGSAYSTAFVGIGYTNSGAGRAYYLYNNAVYNLRNYAYNLRGINFVYHTNVLAYNNTIHNITQAHPTVGDSHGFYASGASGSAYCTLVNNIVSTVTATGSSEAGCYYGAFSTTSTHNLASDLTAPTTGVYWNSTYPTYADAASGNLLLTGPKSTGKDITADPFLAFDTSINSIARVAGSIDIGAFQNAISEAVIKVQKVYPCIEW